MGLGAKLRSSGREANSLNYWANLKLLAFPFQNRINSKCIKCRISWCHFIHVYHCSELIFTHHPSCFAVHLTPPPHPPPHLCAPHTIHLDFIETYKSFFLLPHYAHRYSWLPTFHWQILLAKTKCMNSIGSKFGGKLEVVNEQAFAQNTVYHRKKSKFEWSPGLNEPIEVHLEKRELYEKSLLFGALKLLHII